MSVHLNHLTQSLAQYDKKMMSVDDVIVVAHVRACIIFIHKLLHLNHQNTSNAEIVVAVVFMGFIDCFSFFSAVLYVRLDMKLFCWHHAATTEETWLITLFGKRRKKAALSRLSGLLALIGGGMINIRHMFLRYTQQPTVSIIYNLINDEANCSRALLTLPLSSSYLNFIRFHPRASSHNRRSTEQSILSCYHGSQHDRRIWTLSEHE